MEFYFSERQSKSESQKKKNVKALWAALTGQDTVVPQPVPSLASFFPLHLEVRTSNIAINVL